jgi:hypothetical protein
LSNIINNFFCLKIKCEDRNFGIENGMGVGGNFND